MLPSNWDCGWKNVRASGLESGWRCQHHLVLAQVWSGERFKNAYELLNLRALKFSTLYRIVIFQCMGKIFCVEFQRCPLKFHTKYHTHTLKDAHFIHRWKFKSSQAFLKCPSPPPPPWLHWEATTCILNTISVVWPIYFELALLNSIIWSVKIYLKLLMAKGTLNRNVHHFVIGTLSYDNGLALWGARTTSSMAMTQFKSRIHTGPVFGTWWSYISLVIQDCMSMTMNFRVTCNFLSNVYSSGLGLH